MQYNVKPKQLKKMLMTNKQSIVPTAFGRKSLDLS